MRTGDSSIGSLCISLEPFAGSLGRLTWHFITYEQVGWATATSIIKRSREGMTSRPFHEGLHGGDLEDAARVKGPFMQSAGPAEPVSLKI
jgi:hypothetical protein